MAAHPRLTRAQVKIELDRILERFHSECSKAYGQRLLGILLFGSAAGQVKLESDIDLYVVIEGLPRHRKDRVDEVIRVESGLDAALAILRVQGAHWVLSSQFRTPEELSAFSPLYLDWVDTSRIVHDPKGLLRATIERTARTIREKGAIRVQRGLKWYWILRPGTKATDTVDLGW